MCTAPRREAGDTTGDALSYSVVFIMSAIKSARQAPRCSSIPLRRPKMAQDGLKIGSKIAKMVRRWPQDDLYRLQDGRKRRQDDPKMSKRDRNLYFGARFAQSPKFCVIVSGHLGIIVKRGFAWRTTCHLLHVSWLKQAAYEAVGRVLLRGT